MISKFKLKSPFRPAGDQPKAIRQLVAGVKKGYSRQTLLGVTGSGKTYTMASAIAKTQKPALVISHNKTLAAQLAEEFRQFFPNNAVEYFVSYYDYYQPEAYIARTDTYIAKDASINDEIDRLRHAAMEAVLTRSDTIVVASVSCIYGVGTPSSYLEQSVRLTKGAMTPRRELLQKLTGMQYTRNDLDLTRGTFRVRGDVVDIHPAGEDKILRVESYGQKIDRLLYLDDLTGEVRQEVPEARIFPATFFIMGQAQMKTALNQIREEMAAQVKHFQASNKLLEAQRIEQRTNYDLEMIEQAGYVSGIENYSRHMEGRLPGQASSTLIDYFTYAYGLKGFLTFVDESHMTVPQLSAMYGGDRARKDSLINFGFRLPSARDNRPLKFNEVEDRLGQTVFVSATPGPYEHNVSEQVVEQIVRPTGLLDPIISVRPLTHQVDDIINEIQQTVNPPDKGGKGGFRAASSEAHRQMSGGRILITTLTKRMAEELSTYLVEMGIKCAYLHSDIDTFDRLDILRDLRAGKFDVLVGINLLREGLDLPEVSLVAIMDADKEGYLRSATALIQTMGRAARHVEGRVIMYADIVTGSMKRALEETNRRRKLQEEYNKKHNITPRTIIKAVNDYSIRAQSKKAVVEELKDIPREEISRVLKELTNKMELAAKNLEFETAAQLRDVIKALRRNKRGAKRELENTM